LRIVFFSGIQLFRAKDKNGAKLYTVSEANDALDFAAIGTKEIANRLALQNPPHPYWIILPRGLIITNEQ
jgi:hypothetical protein